MLKVLFAGLIVLCGLVTPAVLVILAVIYATGDSVYIIPMPLIHEGQERKLGRRRRWFVLGIICVVLLITPVLVPIVHPIRIQWNGGLLEVQVWSGNLGKVPQGFFRAGFGGGAPGDEFAAEAWGVHVGTWTYRIRYTHTIR